jgi:hypothetical protein
MHEKTLSRSGLSLSEIPLWSWLYTALALLLLFTVLSASGDLVSPYAAQLAGAAEYVHELAHDGRHLLGVPCH